MAGVLLYNKHLYSEKKAVTEARRQRKLCHGIRCHFDHGVVHLSNYMLIGCHFPRFGTFFELQLHKGQVFAARYLDVMCGEGRGDVKRKKQILFCLCMVLPAARNLGFYK